MIFNSTIYFREITFTTTIMNINRLSKIDSKTKAFLVLIFPLLFAILMASINEIYTFPNYFFNAIVFINLGKQKVFLNEEVMQI
jgi:hypothetical protein